MPYVPQPDTHGSRQCWHCTMLCYATLRYATLRYATLRYAMLCYAMLCYAMLCYAMLCFVVLGMNGTYGMLIHSSS